VHEQVTHGQAYQITANKMAAQSEAHRLFSKNTQYRPLDLQLSPFANLSTSVLITIIIIARFRAVFKVDFWVEMLRGS